MRNLPHGNTPRTLIPPYVLYPADTPIRKADDRCMPNDAPLRIVSADRVRDGLLLAFSDGVVVLYPSHFLISLRDHHENRRLPEDNED